MIHEQVQELDPGTEGGCRSRGARKAAKVDGGLQDPGSGSRRGTEI